jgi:replicative DNA helicase
MSDARNDLPQSLIAEKAVVGAALQNGALADSVLESILPDQCQWPAHRLILSLVALMREEARPVDLVLVTTELEKRGELEEAGGAHYVTEMVTELASVANWRSYVVEVVDAWKRREMLSAALEMAQAARNAGMRVDEAQEQCEQRLFALRENIGRGESTVEHCKAAVIRAVDHIEQVHKSRGKTIGVASGIFDLDRSTGGFLPGQMIVIAARPACGKSALGMQFALHATMNEAVPTLVFSVEMPSTELMVRSICKEAEINLQRLRDGFMSEHKMRDTSVHASRIAKSPLYLDDTPGLTVAQFRSRARRAKMRHGIGLIVVDYLQFMHGSGKNARQSREQEVSEISKAMKTIAKELSVPVIALAQLNRDADEGSKPKLSNLRESGSIEQDADCVLLIHRLDKKKKKDDDEPQDHNTLLIVAKQRNGPTPEIKLNFVGEHTVFHNVTEKAYSNKEEERQR